MIAGIVARVAVLARSVWSGLLRSHVFFCATVTFSLTREIVSLSAHSVAYAQWFYTEMQWPMAVVKALAVLEAFWRIAGHFRKIRGFGWILLGVLAIISAVVSGMVGLLRVNWHGPLSAAIVVGMYTDVALLVVAILTLAFFSQFRGVPIRPNAIHHLALLTLWFGSYFLGIFIAQISAGTSRFTSNVVIDTGALAALSWWTLAMTRDGEKLPFPPGPEISREEFEASEAAHQQAGERIKKAGSQALRKVFRP